MRGCPASHTASRRSTRSSLLSALPDALLALWFKMLGERFKVYDDHRKKEVEKVKAAPVLIDDQIRGKVERFNVDKIRQQDIVASGGGAPDED